VYYAYYTVLLGITGYCRVLQSITRYYRVLQGITGYYRVLQGITGYYNSFESLPLLLPRHSRARKVGRGSWWKPDQLCMLWLWCCGTNSVLVLNEILLNINFFFYRCVYFSLQTSTGHTPSNLFFQSYHHFSTVLLRFSEVRSHSLYVALNYILLNYVLI